MVLLPEQIKAEVQTNGTGQGGNDQQTLCFKMTQVSEPSHPDKFLPDHMLQCRQLRRSRMQKAVGRSFCGGHCWKPVLEVHRP